MSRWVNILVPRAKLAEEEYKAILDFVSSNPDCWERDAVEALERDWADKKEYLFLGEAVGANQSYEDVPYLKLHPSDPLATEYAYVDLKEPTRKPTAADRVRKKMEDAVRDSIKGAGLEFDVTDHGGYGDEETMLLIRKALELSTLIASPLYVRDEGVVPLGGIPRIFHKGKAYVDYAEVSIP